MMQRSTERIHSLSRRRPPPCPRPRRRQGSRRRSPRSPSRGRRGPRGPRRTRPPPCPHRRTSARRRAWRTSGRTCGPCGTKPRRWPSCWRS
eukprot:XP_001706844.1 Hypothetical protein GL50803_32146 [Giardia lamblia ATCC 50803]